MTDTTGMQELMRLLEGSLVSENNDSGNSSSAKSLDSRGELPRGFLRSHFEKLDGDVTESRAELR